ncbi:MAG: SH3 domain-containing protein, partial [Dehalococcoidia bacterium]
MRFLPGPDTRAAVVKHPVVLAGVAVVALLGLTAGVLVIIDSARDGTASGQQVIVETKTETPGPRSKTAIALGVSGRTKSVTAVRFAPGRSTQVLGTLPSGRDVQIDGRTSDDGWYRIIFPPNSELHG